MPCRARDSSVANCVCPRRICRRLTEGTLGKCFRCPRCPHRYSILAGSFFEKMLVPLRDVLFNVVVGVRIALRVCRHDCLYTPDICDIGILVPPGHAYVVVVVTEQQLSIRGLTALRYVHRTVNHSNNFVDLLTGVCTNQVEECWSRLKQSLRLLGVMQSRLLPEYIDEFMWRQIYGPKPAVRRNNLLDQIAAKHTF
nr:unnamed protein product [Callosobruchus analis]